jgi:predicted dehydrogenase/threonine dehydrogenase-like Zn-dependent dehydrogenase
MKQVVQNYRTGELKVEELPPPALRPGGVLVRTAYSLISAGTERTIVETARNSLIGKARQRPDLVKQVFDSFKREGLRSTYQKVKARLDQVKSLGYSASGLVAAVGQGVVDLQVGDAVACAGAGYASHAEANFIPRNLVCKIPEGASLESACYTTLGAIALHSIRQSEAKLGETVAVIGLGLVGQLTVQMLVAAGCRVVGIDIDPLACAMALKCGAELTASNPSDARAACEKLSHGFGADSVIVAASTSSNEPVELAGEIARDRARVVIVGLVGMNVPRHIYYGKELDLRLSRSYGPGRYDPQYEEKGSDYPIGYVRWTENRNMEAFLRLIADGKVNTAILTTHRYPIEQAQEAYEFILGKKERYFGIVLNYPQTEDSLETKIERRKSAATPDDLGVAFIGAGNFARGVLLPIVKRAARVRMTGAATATGLSARNAAEQFGFDYSTTDSNEILGDETTQAVFIATRHDTHARLAAEALRAGKSVFVEKPLATTRDGIRDVEQAARAQGGLLMVGYNRRFAPLAVEINERFKDRRSAMTILYRVNAGQLPPDHWAADEIEGGGRIIGEVCHFVDFVQFMADSMVERVSAQRVSLKREAGFEDDSCSISLSMADGSIASIIYTASGNSLVAKERIEIFCDRAVGVIDDFRSGEFIAAGKRHKLGGGAADKGHAAEIEAFFKAIRSGGDWPIELDSLVRTSQVCLAIVESARRGGEVISFDAEDYLTSREET